MDLRTDTAREALIALASAQHFVVTRAQASKCGFGYRRVRTAILQGWLAEPVAGVLRLTTAAETWEQRVATVALGASGHAVASHRSAARLHRLDGYDEATNAVVELSIERRYRLDPNVQAVVHHVTPLDPSDVVVIRGIRCTSLARTLADLGSVVRDRKQLRRALTAARRRGIDLGILRTTVEHLHRPGQAGTGAMLALLDAVPHEGMVPSTWFEELVLLCIEDRGLPPITLQHPIVGLGGQIVARADLAIPSVKLGLEAHSRRFHFGPDAEGRDEARDLLCAEVGWELMYLGWYAARRPAEVLAHVRSVVRARQELFSGRNANEV